MTYWRLHYHIIWATYERQLIITPEREKMFYGVLYKKGEELGLKFMLAETLKIICMLSFLFHLCSQSRNVFVSSKARVHIPSIVCLGATVNSNGKADMAH